MELSFTEKVSLSKVTWVTTTPEFVVVTNNPLESQSGLQSDSTCSLIDSFNLNVLFELSEYKKNRHLFHTIIIEGTEASLKRDRKQMIDLTWWLHLWQNLKVNTDFIAWCFGQLKWHNLNYLPYGFISKYIELAFVGEMVLEAMPFTFRKWNLAFVHFLALSQLWTITISPLLESVI